jgi:uncharacterized protein (DUF305 family)
MQKNMLIVALAGLLIGGAGGFLVGSHAASPWYGKEHKKPSDVPSHMHMMHDGSLMRNSDAAMSEYNAHMMDMMVTSERAFIEGMIPHHQEAVKTASEVLSRGGSTPAVRELATNIVKAQEREIEDMKQWYETWYGVPYEDRGTYMNMMRPLDALSGAELDRAFLEDMIPHHMGAIMMAKSVTPYLERAELRTLTEAIIATQAEEITTMRELQQDL